MAQHQQNEREGPVDTKVVAELEKALQQLDADFAAFEGLSEKIFGVDGFEDVKELRGRAKSGAYQLVHYLDRLEKKPNPAFSNFVKVRTQQLLGFETALMALMGEKIEAANFRLTATGKLDAVEKVAMPRWTIDLAEQIRQTVQRHGRKMQVGEVIVAALRFASLHLRAFEETQFVLGRPDAVYGSLDAVTSDTAPPEASRKTPGEPPPVLRSRVLRNPGKTKPAPGKGRVVKSAKVPTKSKVVTSKKK